MMNYREQVQLFKDLVPIGPRSTSALIKQLKGQVDTSNLSLEELPVYLADMIVFNACHCLQNDGIHLQAESMSFLVFEVMRNEKSRRYFLEKTDEERVYAVFEEHSGFIWSNSNHLFLEMEFARGVSRQEIDEEGLEFRCLISHLAIDYCSRNTEHACEKKTEG